VSLVAGGIPRVTSLSIAPSALGEVRASLAKVTYEECPSFAVRVLSTASAMDARRAAVSAASNGANSAADAESSAAADAGSSAATRAEGD
jgi:hypothetical protein